MYTDNGPPIHPGEVLVQEFLVPLKLTQECFVKHLGGTWTQPKISDIINKKRKITESIALDLSDALGTTPEYWLSLQHGYDLWFARQKHNKISLLPALKEKVNHHEVTIAGIN